MSSVDTQHQISVVAVKLYGCCVLMLFTLNATLCGRLFPLQCCGHFFNLVGVCLLKSACWHKVYLLDLRNASDVVFFLRTTITGREKKLILSIPLSPIFSLSTLHPVHPLFALPEDSPSVPHQPLTYAPPWQIYRQRPTIGRQLDSHDLMSPSHWPRPDR